MATKRKLQVRYGAAASRPTLSTGELGLDTDTGSEYLHVGTPAGNKRIGGLLGVKRYVALLTQAGVSAPTAVVLENSLGGTVAWSYVGSGQYYGTLTGAFTASKTVGICAQIPSEQAIVGAVRVSDNQIAVSVINAVDGQGYDDLLSGTAIQITVYP